MLKVFKIKFTFLFGFFCFGLSSQINLVPNSSFEDTVNCPQDVDDVFKCKFWSSYRNSPNYFNSCASYSIGISTPFNVGGYQVPKSGNAYIGAASYITRTNFPNYREFLGAKLTNTLILNQKYFFSMKCVATKSIWGPSNCYSSKLGVNFSKTSYTPFNPYLINNTAKVFANSIINDTVNWKTIKGSFISDSSYQYIIIGNFFNDNLTDTLIFDANTNCTAYYFIDDVCLSTDSAFAYNYSPQGIFENSFQIKDLKIYPNPATTILNIEGRFLNENYSIINVFGIAIKKGIFQNDKNAIDVSNFPNGVYFLRVRERKIKVLVNN